MASANEKNVSLATVPLLSLRGFGVAFGEKIVLGSVDLDVPDCGVTVLMGPMGTGKSTLLRTITGVNDAVPTLRTWGVAHYLGEPLSTSERPALVAQNMRLVASSVLENMVHDLPERGALTLAGKRELAARLLQHAKLDELKSQLDMQVVQLPLELQRRIAIARTAAARPRLLCIDEPTAGLDEQAASRILSHIRLLGEYMGVLVVLHNQQQARELGGQTALLAGGWVQDCSPTKEFFQSPASPVVADFIRTGSCNVPSPNTRPEDLDDAPRPEPPPLPSEAVTYVSDALGPRGFLWLKKGRLAGTPKPGVVADTDYDLKALQRVGVTVLVSLTSSQFDQEQLRAYGIAGRWLPIKDMGVPTIAEAISMCEEVDSLLARGEVVAIHCRAGLGRTGTMLAAQLIWEGSTALEALESVRRVEPRWVQSDEQVLFLENFASAVKRPSTTEADRSSKS